MAKLIDRVGMRFGSLVVTKYLGDRKWLCQCDCGNTVVVDSSHLTINGKRRSQKSCGCLIGDRLTKNIDYFDKIDDEYKAYILGFLAADGTISYNTKKGLYTIKLVVNSVDTKLLLDIKKSVGTLAEVKTYVAKTNLPQGGQCESEFSSLLICGKKITEDVIKYGVTPKKSLTLNIKYELIPDELKRHFWRGLWDGDGNFGVYGERQLLEMSLVSSKLMCQRTKEEINKIFTEMNLSCYDKIGAAKEVGLLALTKQDDIKNFLDYIYKDSNIYLERKYNKYKKIIK